MSDDSVPTELLQKVDPPQALLDDLQNKPLCGGRFEIMWANGPLRGKRSTAYCAEPKCIQTRYCTGPKFVAHSIQHEPDGSVRRLEPTEIVPAARQCARMATGRDDPRSDREIFAFALLTYKRMSEAIKGRL